MNRQPLTMTVRMAPPRELSPNASLHVKPGHRNRLRDEWRKAWAWAAYEATSAAMFEAPYFDGPVRVTLSYRRGRNAKPWDTDNLISTAKAGADQLAPMKIVADDKQIVDWIVEQERADDGIGLVVVTVEAHSGQRAAGATGPGGEGERG
jgi:Holliday junction resolvase RusA-like endonuclease